MLHDQLHPAILREQRRNAIYAAWYKANEENPDAHRTLKYALIILPVVC